MTEALTQLQEALQQAPNLQTLEGKVLITLVMLLVAVLVSAGSSSKASGSSHQKDYFKPKRKLLGKDQLLLDMLNPQTNNFVITDPSLPDNPIIYASDSFCRFTGYPSSEIQGRNCRFLQGKDSSPTDVKKIRDAIDNQKEENVNLLNYKKDGTTFINQFFITPLREDESNSNGALRQPMYYIGIQHEVKSKDPGQHPDNVGWVYTFASQQ